MTANDGATPERNDIPGMADKAPECMRRWKHSLSWIWKAGRWTDFRRCNTCGKVFDKDGREVEEKL